MTQRNRDDCPLWFDDPDDFGRLRDVLAGAQFTDQGVVDALGVETVRSASSQDLALLLRCTSGGLPLDTLIRLFLVGVSVDVGAARRAAAPMALAAWAGAGLVVADGESVRATVQLLPFQGLVLAYDRPHAIRRGLPPDYVMGVGSSSLTLAALTVRRPSRLTLDLGTGCGFQAFLAAPHSTRVVATDRNPRAVHLAAFNARLNGLANVECVQGDLFEPVQGQQFDLVVSNPPFVISPERRYIYRDSGMAGDAISRTIVREAPAFLREGAYCQILCNWAHVGGQDWRERLRTWSEGTGCDVWAMRSHTQEPADYAAKWIRHTERDEAAEFQRRLDQWTAYYEQERIEAVSSGLITLRRRSGQANWFRADDGAEKILGAAGDSVAGGFALRDFVEGMRSDEAWMGQRLRVSPDARLEQRFEPSPEGWAVLDSQLRLARGLGYSGDVDPYMTLMIARCNGERPLGELVAELAASLGMEPAHVAPACLDVVRRLVERGFLLPEGHVA